MSEWKEYKLTDIAEILNHKRIPLSSIQRNNRKGKFPYYGASGIVDYIDDYIFDGEYVLISEDGENLRSRNTPIAFFAKGKFWVNNHSHIIKGKSDAINKWIIYYIQNININPYLTGAVQPKLNKENLLSIPFFLPSSKGQIENIIQILSSLDDKIELNNKINQELENLAQTLFKRWFIDFEFPNENGEPYKSSGGEMVDSELGEIPKGWRIGTLKDEFIINMGQSPKGDTYNETGDGMIFFQGRSDFGFRFPSVRMFTNDPKKVAKKFETLISVRAPVGDINMAENDCCVGRGLGSISHPSEFFSYTYYKMLSIQDELKSYDNEGTVFGSINKETLGNIKTIIPPLSLSDSFDDLVKQKDTLIYNFTNQNQELTHLRNTLLPKLISGELEVQQVFSQTT